jgi:hypothetical protein
MPKGMTPLTLSMPRSTLIATQKLSDRALRGVFAFFGDARLRPRLLAPFALMGFGLVQCSGTTENAPPFDDGKPTEFEPIKFHPQTLRVPHSFSNSVIVEDGRITVPNTPENQAVLAKITVNKVIAGDRDRSRDNDFDNSPNPFGFVVQVIKIEPSGSNTVLSTVPRRLSDVIKSGTLRLAPDEPNIFDMDDNGNVIPGSESAQRLASKALEARELRTRETLQTLAVTNKSETYNAKGEPKSGNWKTETKNEPKSTDRQFFLGVKDFSCEYRLAPSLENSRIDYKETTYKEATYTVSPEFGGQADGEVERTEQSVKFARLVMSINPSVTCNYTASFSWSNKDEKYAGKAQAKYTSGQSPSVRVPFAVGAIPVVAEFYIGYSLGITGKADIELPVTAQVSGRAAVGAEWDGGRKFTNLSETNRDVKFSLGKNVTFKTSLGLEAKGVIGTKLLVGGVFGLKAEGGVKGTAGVKGCYSQSSQYLFGELNYGWFFQPEVIIKVPLVKDVNGKDKEFSLVRLGEFAGDIGKAAYPEGSDKSKCGKPQEESCDGKKDGFYCSANQDDYAFECRNKKYVTGVLCPNSGFATCKGGASNPANLDVRGNLICE